MDTAKQIIKQVREKYKGQNISSEIILEEMVNTALKFSCKEVEWGYLRFACLCQGGILKRTISKMETLMNKRKNNKKSESPALRVGAVSSSFLCAHGAENRCKEQCFTCSEDEKCDVKYSYKATMIHYFQFTEWIAERYNYIGGEWCCWCAKQYDVKDTERYKDTGELWKYWWENCR